MLAEAAELHDAMPARSPSRALACKFIHPGRVAAKVAADVTLPIYSLWLAHDHIDSPVLPALRLPRNPGLQSEIREALAIAH